MKLENGEQSSREMADSQNVKKIWDYILEIIDKLPDEETAKMKKRLKDVGFNEGDYDEDCVMTLTALDSLNPDGIINLTEDINSLSGAEKHLPGIHSLPSKITVLNTLRYLEKTKNPAK